eukprot:COSAG01_NODE_7553_length_3153_cov_9.276686_3_plen_151_part_00
MSDASEQRNSSAQDPPTQEATARIRLRIAIRDTSAVVGDGEERGAAPPSKPRQHSLAIPALGGWSVQALADAAALKLAKKLTLPVRALLPPTIPPCSSCNSVPCGGRRGGGGLTCERLRARRCSGSSPVTGTGWTPRTRSPPFSWCAALR